MRTVHIFRKHPNRWWSEGDPALCGNTDIVGDKHAALGKWLDVYFRDNYTGSADHCWCPECVDAICPLDELAHTDL